MICNDCLLEIEKCTCFDYADKTKNEIKEVTERYIQKQRTVSDIPILSHEEAYKIMQEIKNGGCRE